jgi:DNA mismatch repair protein MutS
VLNLQGFGLAPDHPALGPAGALVYYATENLCAKPENLRGLQEYRSARMLLLDPATLRNLEVFTSTRGTREGSLLHAINRTATATGARLLERWLASPTLELPVIQRRQVIVGEFSAQPGRLTELHELLAGVRDIPRILGRLQNRLRNPRELGGVRDTLAQLPAIRATLAAFGSSPQLGTLAQQLHELPALRDSLAHALADTLPNDLSEGNYIRAGHDAELDRLRSSYHRQQDLALRPRTRRAGTHRHPQPQGPLHEQFWVLHRGHQGQPPSGARGLHPAPNHRGRRALRHRSP